MIIIEYHHISHRTIAFENLLFPTKANAEKMIIK